MFVNIFSADKLYINAANKRKKNLAVFTAEMAVEMGKEDQSLAREAANGDRKAFDQLVLKYEKKIFNLAYRICGNYDDASELAQEAFIKAFKSIGSFRADSEFGTWLYRITLNVCYDFIRKNKKQNIISISEVGEEGYIIQNLHSNDISPGDYAENRETIKEITNAIGTLKEDQRTMIILRDIEGFTYSEIAKILKISEGTVKSRINRARLSLSNILSAKLEHLSARSVKNVRKGG